MWYRVLGMGVFYESRVRIQEFIGEFTLRWAHASERQQNEHVGHATKGSGGGMRILLAVAEHEVRSKRVRLSWRAMCSKAQPCMSCAAARQRCPYRTKVVTLWIFVPCTDICYWKRIRASPARRSRLTCPDRLSRTA